MSEVYWVKVGIESPHVTMSKIFYFLEVDRRQEFISKLQLLDGATVLDRGTILELPVNQAIDCVRSISNGG